MIGHTLKVYPLLSPSQPYMGQGELPIHVVADHWHYARGRDIEFIAVGMPDRFAFMADEKINTQSSDMQYSRGDCRQGSWAGIATKIGVNRYQGIQATGLENPATGFISWGSKRQRTYATFSADSDVVTRALGQQIDHALVEAYSYGTDASGIADVRAPFYSLAASDAPPAIAQILWFVDNLTDDTKVVTGDVVKMREDFYKKTGHIATTNFTNRPGAVVGGITHLSVGNQAYNTTTSIRLANSQRPQIENGIGQVIYGGRGNADWETYILVYSKTIAELQGLRMMVDNEGVETFGLVAFPDKAAGGVLNLQDALTFETDDVLAVANTPNNQQVLKDFRKSFAARTLGYKVSYPICVPIRFRNPSITAGTRMSVTNAWTMEADFIEHEYTIGGE